MAQKIMFLPTLHFYIMPNLKVQIINFVMMHDVGVCRPGTSGCLALPGTPPITGGVCLPAVEVRPISEFGISFRMRQLGVIREKQTFTAAAVAREEYFFCGPSPGMFLFIPCFS